jgi:hypothetical protein
VVPGLVELLRLLRIRLPAPPVGLSRRTIVVDLAIVAAAGTVAVVLGIPGTLLFGLHLLDDGVGFSPIVVLSTLAWLGAYLAGGGRARPVYLAAAAAGLWAFVLETLGDLEQLPLLFLPVVTFDGYYDDESFGRGSLFGRPDLTTTAVLSLAVGGAYVLLSRRMDRRGAAGIATPLLVAGIPAGVLGCIALADELHPAGAGVVAVVLGGLLAVHGASVSRRATTWIGGALVAAGAAAVLGDLSDDTAVGGVLFLLGGLGLVAGAHALAARFGEPHELPDPPAKRRRLVAKPADADVVPEA